MLVGNYVGEKYMFDLVTFCSINFQIIFYFLLYLISVKIFIRFSLCLN